MKYKGKKLPYFIAKRLAFGGKKSFSTLIIRLSIAGVAVSVAIMIISVAIVTGFQKEVREKVIGFGGHAEISALSISNSFEHSPVHRDSALLFDKNDFPGISHIQAYAVKPGIIKAKENNEGILLKGVDKGFNWDFFRKHLLEGRVIELPDNEVSDEVLISKVTADKLLLKTGDDLYLYFIQNPVRTRRLKITGIFETGLEEFDKLYAICDIRHIQQLNGWGPGYVSGFEVLLDNFERLDETRDFINNNLELELQCRTIRDMNPKIFDWLGLLDTNVNVILILMAIVAVINMITALFILIIEGTNMIGILRSLGANARTLRRIYLYQALYLGLSGLLIGNIAGIGLCLIQRHTHFIRLDQGTYYTSYAPVEINWDLILLINVFTLLVCLLAVLIPVRQVSRVTPLKAIRFD